MGNPDPKAIDQGSPHCPISEEFKKLCEEFRKYRSYSVVSMNQVNVIHKVVTEDIVEHVKHLEKLEEISKTLDTFTATLIAAVTGKKHVSTNVFLVTVFLLAAILMVVLMKTSGLNLELSSSGLKIESVKSRADDTSRNTHP